MNRVFAAFAHCVRSANGEMLRIPRSACESLATFGAALYYSLALVAFAHCVRSADGEILRIPRAVCESLTTFGAALYSLTLVANASVC